MDRREDYAIRTELRRNAQTTLARSISLQGRGAHGGRGVRMTLAPAEAGSGVVFIVPGGAIDAHWSHVDATALRMRLAAKRATVSTVEHLLAALAGLGVDNALITLDGDEVPAMDGSAADFVAAIDEGGIVGLAAPRSLLRVLRPVHVSDGAGWAELSPPPSGASVHGLRLDVEIAFGAGVGRQRFVLDVTPDAFRRKLARARTFGFLRDAERLWRQGLALGASLDNTVVYDGAALLNPEGLRFPDELVRHKMLDVVGDLALAGAPVIGCFRSYRGGHGLNLALLKAAAEAKALRLEAAPAARAGVAAASAIMSPEGNHSF